MTFRAKLGKMFLLACGGAHRFGPRYKEKHMKIIKRNGSEAVFDISKIIAAITKANNVVDSTQRLTKEQILSMADQV